MARPCQLAGKIRLPQDGAVPIDNNFIERQIKPWVSVSLHAVTFELSFGTYGPFIVSLCFVARGVTRFCHPISQAHVVT